MSWRIRFAYNSREDPLDVHALELASRGLEDEDALVARQLALDFVTDRSMQTVGDALDHLERIGQQGRRELLNEARAACGLESTAAVDASRRLKAWQQGHAHLVQRDEGGCAYLTCAHPGCGAFPVDPTTGGQAPTNVRRWFCGAHRREAEPGDMQPWTPGISFAPGGGLQFDDDVEVERKRSELEEQRRAARREQRRAEREAEGEALERDQAAMAERWRMRGAGWDS
jgi:hypothetical protein